MPFATCLVSKMLPMVGVGAHRDRDRTMGLPLGYYSYSVSGVRRAQTRALVAYSERGRDQSCLVVLAKGEHVVLTDDLLECVIAGDFRSSCGCGDEVVAGGTTYGDEPGLQSLEEAECTEKVTEEVTQIQGRRR